MIDSKDRGDDLSWEEILAAAREDRLSDAQRHELNARMASDPGLRREYAERMLLESALRWELARTQICPEQPPIQLPGAQRLRKNHIAAAILLLAATGIGLWQAFKYAADNTPPIAMIAESREAVWDKKLSTPPVGEPITGRILKLTSGLAQIDMSNGAMISMRGPAEVYLKDQNHVEVKSGKLTAKVPAPPGSLIMQTPAGKIADSGAEYGLNVAERGDTEVHVFDGKVEVELGGKGPKKGPLLQIDAREARRINPQNRVDGVNLGEEAFEKTWQAGPAAPQAPVPIPTTLTAHFPLENDLQELISHRLGVGPVVGFEQDPHRSAVRLDGNSGIDFGQTTFNTRFTLSLWFWIDPEARRGLHIIASAMTPNGNGFRLVAWNPTEANRSILYRSVRSLATNDATAKMGTFQMGRWHHVAAVVNRPEGIARIYIDGNDVTADETVFNSVNPQPEREYILQLGMQTGRPAMEFLRGKLSDVRIYQGLLTPHEIRRLAGKTPLVGSLLNPMPGWNGLWTR